MGNCLLRANEKLFEILTSNRFWFHLLKNKQTMETCTLVKKCCLSPLLKLKTW